MKDKILALLKPKFEGVSDAILSRIADKLAKTATTEGTATTLAEGVTFQQVLESYGDARATEASETAVKNYEKKHNLKEGKVIEAETKPVEQPQQDDDVPTWAKALIEANKALTEQMNTMKAERTTTNRKQQLDKVLAKLPEAMRKGYERIDYSKLNDETFATELATITTEVDNIAKDFKARGAVFGRPQEGKENKGGELSEEQIKAIASPTAKAADAQPF